MKVTIEYNHDEIEDGDLKLFQKSDGTVMKRENGHWFYLSPLFGEWLPVYDREPSRDSLKKYPRNINCPIELVEDNAKAER